MLSKHGSIQRDQLEMIYFRSTGAIEPFGSWRQQLVPFHF
ncbi:hypothetical protein SRABI84_01910 [Peribacillus simplex]|nr:hypothetical protein SRABI84_01910 [Peribacillus simplex]